MAIPNIASIDPDVDSIEPLCSQADRAANFGIPIAAESLRNACLSSQGGDGNEWGTYIYVDNLTVTFSDPYTSGSPTEVDHLTDGIDADGVDPLSVIGFMHCHHDGNTSLSRNPNRNSDDTRTLRRWGEYTRRYGMFGAAGDLTSTVVTEDEEVTYSYVEENDEERRCGEE